MLTEVTGETLAGRWLTAKPKEQKTMLAMAVVEKPDWMPSWMRFLAIEAI